MGSYLFDDCFYCIFLIVLKYFILALHQSLNIKLNNNSKLVIKPLLLFLSLLIFTLLFLFFHFVNLFFYWGHSYFFYSILLSIRFFASLFEENSYVSSIKNKSHIQFIFSKWVYWTRPYPFPNYHVWGIHNIWQLILVE